MIEPSFSDLEVTDLGLVDAQLPSTIRFGHVPHAPFGFWNRRVARGTLRVEETRCTDGVDMRPPEEHGYLVGLPVCGTLHVDQGGQELDLGPGWAAVVAPAAEATMAAAGRFDVLFVDMGTAALEDMLEALLGRPVSRPLRLATHLSLNIAAGQAWVDTVRSVVDTPAERASVLTDPISAEPIWNWILATLLCATDHPYRDALDAPVPTWGPRPVRRCVDYIEAYPEQSLTPVDLATEAGLSIRALDGCWLRHRDVRPRQDVGRVRLGRAHTELRSYGPGETTVAAVARSWGFRPRTFATAYGMRFGRPPMQTLRGPAFA